MIRFYLCPYGPGYIPSRPQARAAKVILYLNGARHDATPAYPYKDWCVCSVGADQVVHDAIQADAEITLIPFWDGPDPSTANYLPLTALVLDVAQPHRGNIVTFMENHRVPTGWIEGTHTLGRVIRYVVQVLVIVQLLKEDYPELDLDSQVSDIPGAQRQRILQWMKDHDIETEDVTLSWTIRQVLRRMTNQYGWQAVLALGQPLL